MIPRITSKSALSSEAEYFLTTSCRDLAIDAAFLEHEAVIVNARKRYTMYV
jgi:hypothetical protein